MTSEPGSSGVHPPPDPPDAPEIPRRVSFFRWQAIGMLIIAAIPIAALAGVFGDRWGPVQAQAGAVQVTGRVPTLMRYKTLNPITLHVSNTSAQLLDTVGISLDTTYSARFSTVSATPPFNGSYVITLAALAPRTSTLITIELQAEQYGRHEGFILIHTGPDSARIEFSTIVLP